EELLDQMDENDATYDTVKSYLDNLVDVDLTQKVDNIVKFIKNIESDAEMYKAEKQRLDKLEKTTKKKAENLKNYLIEILNRLGYDYKNKKKIKTSIGNVGFKKNPPILEIFNIDKVPTEWDKPKEREIRKSDLLKYLKEQVEKLDDEVLFEELGVKISNNKSSLQIK
ncbi:MAG: siphovirus Gp157 family protein, partial [Niallia sp.]